MRPQALTRYEWDSTSLTAVGAAVAAAVAAFVTGLWQFISGRKKLDTDAHASLLSGFVSLLTSVQGERDRLLGRLNVLEDENRRLDQRVGKLERTMRKHHVAVPDGDED